MTLVLLVACANVANLMTARASSRAKELSLRVSIGAPPWRLMQMVLVGSAWIAGAASVLGALFAWWAAPVVVGVINPSDNPARLVLLADWRLLGFGALTMVIVTALFALPPALRASAVAPLTALKAGADPHARRGLMHALIACQVAFCVLVVFLGSLLVATFTRLSQQPTGFSADGVIALEAVAKAARAPAAWNDVAEHLRAVPGVEAVALTDQALLVNDATNTYLSIDGAPPTRTLAFFRDVSPGWLNVMRIPLMDGRDIAAGDTAPGVAIVNETFAKTFFEGKNPVGRSFARAGGGEPYRTIGVIRDVRYRSMREPILSIAFVPFQHVTAAGALQEPAWGTFLVRPARAGAGAPRDGGPRAAWLPREHGPNADVLDRAAHRPRAPARHARRLLRCRRAGAHGGGTVWRAGLLRAAATAGARHSVGDRGARGRDRLARHAADRRGRVRRRRRGPWSRLRCRTRHGRAVLSGARHGVDDGGDAGWRDHCGGRTRLGPAGDPRAADQSAGDAPSGLKSPLPSSGPAYGADRRSRASASNQVIAAVVDESGGDRPALGHNVRIEDGVRPAPRQCPDDEAEKNAER